jgi:alpha-ribazole phosphatase
MLTRGPTNVWLIRHAEPEAQARNRCYGKLDVALSSEGLRQAGAVAETLREQPFTRIYTSPRRRCVQAAEILALRSACPVESSAEFVEMDFGEFEGCSYNEIAESHPEIYRQWMENPTEVRFPGGECFEDVWARVTQAAALLRQRHSGETIGVVSHGGPIRVLIAEALDMPRANIFRLAQGYAAMNLIRYFENSALVEIFNATPSGLRAQ